MKALQTSADSYEYLKFLAQQYIPTGRLYIQTVLLFPSAAKQVVVE